MMEVNDSFGLYRASERQCLLCGGVGAGCPYVVEATKKQHN